MLLLLLALPFPARSAVEPVTFRVMTYNIHHGEGVDGQVDLARLAAVIQRERADVVLLQEVDKGVQRTDRRDLPAELAQLTGLSCLFSNNYAFQGGEYGNAILTRFPVRQSTNTHLVMLRDGEQRGLLQATLDCHGRPLLVWNTHIDHRPDDAERVRNVRQFREILAAQAGAPLVFGGDFNDRPDSRVYQLLREHFVDTWLLAGQGPGYTIPSEQPTRRIDYLWITRNAPLIPRKAWVPETTASDHRPVVVEFSWVPPAP